MFFVWGIIGIAIILIIFMPKRLTFRENIMVFPFVGYFAWISHILIGVKLDLLDFGPTKKVEYTDWALVSLVPPLLAVLFLNFYKEKQYLLYVFIWTAVSFIIELILTKVGYMKHLEWKIWYSIPVYFIAYYLLHLLYTRVVKHM